MRSHPTGLVVIDSKKKPGRFAKLPRSQRNRVRVVARDAFLETDGNVGKAIAKAVDRVRLVAGSEHLTLAGALAIRLIRYWDANNVFEPEAVFVPGEPGFDGGDE